jgi:hypothetical protein
VAVASAQIAETQSLVQRINRTNVRIETKSGATLADAIVERDHLLILRGQLEAIANAASEPQQRYMRSEIRVVRTVEPAELRRRADALSRPHRVIDLEIQEADWSYDLAE